MGQDGLNPTVKAKNDSFWKDITLRMVGLPELDKVLLSSNEEELADENKAKKEQFEKIPAETWQQLANWGKVAKKLSLLERKKLDHAFALSSADKKLPFSIISDVMDIYKKSQDLGFIPQASGQRRRRPDCIQKPVQYPLRQQQVFGSGSAFFQRQRYPYWSSTEPLSPHPRRFGVFRFLPRIDWP